MMDNGEILQSRSYPSPNPTIKLYEQVYLSSGLKVKGLLAVPIEEGSYEGIIYLRGGIQHVGMVRPARITQIAAQGFVVFAPYYRGNRGGEGRDEFAGDDLMDAVNAVEVIKQCTHVNRERIHLFAFSRGGIMALWAGILRNDITSIVTWGGVSDIIFMYKERKDLRRMMKRVIGGTPNNNPNAYRNRTALFRLEEINAPVLIVHGLLDKNVSFEQALLLENALVENKKSVETRYFPNYTHYIPPVKNLMILKEVCAWMKTQ